MSGEKKENISKIGNFFKNLPDWFIKQVEKVKNLERKTKIILAVVLLLVIIAIISLIVFSINSKKLGNLVGNINNNGIAVKDGSAAVISYTNTEDGNDSSEKVARSGIYKVNSNGKVKTYETFGENVYGFSVNKVGNWIYYMKVDDEKGTRDIVKTNGNKRVVIAKDLPSYVKNSEYLIENYTLMTIEANYIYYLNENQNITRIKTNGKNKEVIRDDIKAKDFVVYKDYIYLNTDDNEFMKIKIKDFEEKQNLKNINANDFQVEGKYIYYIDKANKLLRVDLNGNNEKVIVDKQIQSFNVIGNEVYYFAEESKSSSEESNEFAIFKLNMKNNETKKIVDTAYSASKINIAGNYIYYDDRIDGDIYYNTVYKVKLDGSEKEDLGQKVLSAEVKEFDIKGDSSK